MRENFAASAFSKTSFIMPTLQIAIKISVCPTKAGGHNYRVMFRERKFVFRGS